MDAVRTFLIARGSQMLLLLNPPFDRSAQDPGYIKGYPPGVRENGGQYTHAAVWVVMALARLGSGDEAAEFFHMLNPVNHGRTAADVARYKTEPYVMAGDVYARPPHAGRGGWSWYTGSAGWMYRAGIESILGLRRRGETFVIDPCIPSSWPEYRIAWRFLDSRYEITVSNPTRRCRGVVKATLDGAPVNAAAIPLLNDGRTHDVQIVLGDQPQRELDVQRLTVASERGIDAWRLQLDHATSMRGSQGLRFGIVRQETRRMKRDVAASRNIHVCGSPGYGRHNGCSTSPEILGSIDVNGR